MHAAAVIAIQPIEKRMPAPRKHAASCSNCNVREFISSRVTNYMFHPVYGGAIMNALALR